MQELTYESAAAWLRDFGYAPVPIGHGNKQPEGPWMMYQLDYPAIDRVQSDPVAVLTSLPQLYGPPPAGSCLIERFADTWLITLETQVRAELKPQVDAIIKRYVGAAKCPVRVDADGAQLNVFRIVEGVSAFPAMATSSAHQPDFARIESRGSFVALVEDVEGRPYEWRNGNLLSVRRSELPALDRDTARALVEEIDTLLWKNCEPAPECTPFVPSKELVFSNGYVRALLARDGYHPVEVPSGIGVALSGRQGGLVSLSIASEHADLLAAADALLSRSQLWAVGAKVPVRIAPDGSLLRLFKLRGGALQESETHCSVLVPGSPVRKLTITIANSGHVALSGANGPFTWRDGADPLTVPFEKLADLNYGVAKPLIDGIRERVWQFETLPAAAPTPVKTSRRRA